MRNKQEKIVEIWRDVRGYEGLYQVSNLGKVKSLKFGKERILKPQTINGGYLLVGLRKVNYQKWFLVHRLVAQTFLENPEGLPFINHKDENKTNNFVYVNEDGSVDPERSNLEWISHKDNCNYGTRNARIAAANSVVQRNRTDQSKQVAQIDKTTGEIVRIWPSTMECKRQGFHQGHVAACARGEESTHKGFLWRYIN